MFQQQRLYTGELTVGVAGYLHCDFDVVGWRSADPVWAFRGCSSANSAVWGSSATGGGRCKGAAAPSLCLQRPSAHGVSCCTEERATAPGQASAPGQNGSADVSAS